MTTDETGFPVDSPDTPTKPDRRLTWKRWVAIGVAAVVVLAGAGVGAFLLLRPSSNPPTTFTRDVQATKGTRTQTVTFDGTLSPSKESDVNYGVSGTVTKVYVKAGDKVSKNQKLARIDDSDLQNAVALAEANLTTARANYTEVVDNDGSSAAITSAGAQVRSAKAALTSAQEDLTHAVLRSPITGTVASVGLEVGDTVGSSNSGTGSSSGSSTSAQVVIIATSKWKVEGTVGASDLSSVKAGQSVSVTTDAGTDALKGTVASVGIMSTSTSSDGAAAFPVEVTISGTHTNLFSGTTATAVITTGSYADVVTVPTAAITTSDGKTVVTKVTNNQASTVEVTVGKVFGSATEVTSGISEGDTVRITITRPTGTSTSSTNGGISFGGGGLGGGFGGGAPPAGAPGGTGNGGNR